MARRSGTHSAMEDGAAQRIGALQRHPCGMAQRSGSHSAMEDGAERQIGAVQINPCGMAQRSGTHDAMEHGAARRIGACGGDCCEGVPPIAKYRIRHDRTLITLSPNYLTGTEAPSASQIVGDKMLLDFDSGTFEKHAAALWLLLYKC